MWFILWLLGKMIKLFGLLYKKLVVKVLYIEMKLEF